jgi:CubicO group peptidase (beta-lactamase class C family)
MHPTTPHPSGAPGPLTVTGAHGALRRTALALSAVVASLALVLLGAGESSADAPSSQSPGRLHASESRGPSQAPATAENDSVHRPADDLASERWTDLMGDALARTALAPGAQAPAAWAVIEPDPAVGTDPAGAPVLTTSTGGSGGADADTPFLIGSLSKPLTAAAVMRLVDTGRIRIDAGVREYLPDFRPQDETPVTIAQLLTHTSGFGADAGLAARREPALSIADRAAAANEIPRSEANGVAAFEYSNLNYAVLGAVIEAVSGERFATHLDRELFAPLGMLGSSAEPATAQEVAAAGHRLAFGVPIPFEETVPSGAAPDGYTVSTARDLAAFARMLLRGGIADDGSVLLSAESARAILAEHVPTGAPGAAAPGTTGYGLGWGTGGSGSSPVAAHVGRTEGFFAHAHLRPGDGQAVVLVQATNSPLYEQTSPTLQAVAALEGRDPGGASGEPAGVTAAILAAFGAVLLGAVLLVGRLRARRDRRAPAPTHAAAARRAAMRASFDIGGAILVVSLWSVAAGMMLTGSPSWSPDPLAASIELTLISWLIGALLLGRGIATVVRHRRAGAAAPPARPAPQPAPGPAARPTRPAPALASAPSEQS